MNPSKHKMSVLAQICKLIPGNIVSKLSWEHGADKQCLSLVHGAAI